MRLLQQVRPFISRALLSVSARARPHGTGDHQPVPAFRIAVSRPGESRREETLETPHSPVTFDPQHPHHKRRRVQLKPYLCPCCTQPCLSPAKLGVHIQKCCPDLLKVQASGARFYRVFLTLDDRAEAKPTVAQSFCSVHADLVTCRSGRDCKRRSMQHAHG